jgi:hypothetical protein
MHRQRPHDASGLCGRESQRTRSFAPRLILFLPPVARDPHPPARCVRPMTPNPHCSRLRRHNPTARYPHVVGSGPAPVAGRPDISRAWDHRLRFNANCWRSLGHDNLSRGRACRRNLPRGRRGHSSWFLSAAGKRQRHQRQYINIDSHMYASVCRFVLHQRIGFVRTGDNNFFSTRNQ